MPLAIFAANDGTRGVELWRTDGTSGGTYLLKDIVPGSVGSNIGNTTRSGDYVYFTATDETGFSLWRTDGSEAGTVRLTSLSTTGAELFDHEGILYFSSGLEGTQLGKTDGSIAGTMIVADTGSAGAIHFLGNTTNGIAFTTADRMLWRSEGTAATTVQVTSISGVQDHPLNSTDQADLVISYNGLVIFSRFVEGVTGNEVWRTDGTAGGTFLLRDIRPGANSSAPHQFTVFNDRVYFLATDNSLTTALWTTDGTVAGTSLVRTVDGAYDMAASGDQLLIARRASNFPEAYSLVVSDGTFAGTVPVEETPSGAQLLTGAESLGYFVSYVRNHSDPAGPSFGELWRTDGTAAGTFVLRDILPGFETSDPSGLTPFGDELLFSADNRTNGYELWASDGTSAGTRLIFDINTVADPIAPLDADFNKGFAELGSPGAGFEVLFSAARSVQNNQTLWSSDGQSSLELAAFTSGISALTAVGDKAFFFAGDALWTSNGLGSEPVIVKDSVNSVWGAAFEDRFFFVQNNRLWSSDGTLQGTVEVKTGVTSVTDPDFTVSGDKLYFKTTNSNSELWVSDGTTGGTHAIDVRPSWFADVRELTDANGTLYLVANVTPALEGQNYQLLRTNGTTVTIVESISDGSGARRPMGLIDVGGTLYFTVDDGVNGRELWRSDGTEAGTFLVKDIVDGSVTSNPTNLTEAGGKLYFLATDALGATRLWVSDGTEAGTVQVPNLTLPVQNLANAGGRLVFTYDDGVHGRELWTSDGTAAGTHSVTELIPGSAGISIENIFSTETYAYFEFVNPAIGMELWRTDGTAAGTERISDVAGPSSSSRPYGFVVLDLGDGFGTEGPDFISGTTGDDELHGLGGDDILAGDLGADLLDGGAGSDTADYSQATGAVFASLLAGSGAGNAAEGDTYVSIENLVGTAFNDVLVGNDGDNRLEGGNGVDYLYALGGTNVLRGGAGADFLYGASGSDTADYSGNFGAIRIDLAAGSGRWNYAEGDLLASIDNVSGTEFNDVLFGTSEANTLLGNGGDDLIAGGAGADGLAGGAGIDTLSYAGNFGGVEIDLAAGTGLWNYAHGDVLSGFENVIGTDYGDILRGDGSNNRFEGGQGDDQLTGGAGNDHLIGGTGADRLDGGVDFDTADYSAGFGGIYVDLLSGQGLWNSAQGDTLTGIDKVIGTAFGDVFWGNGVTNYFTGGGGNDEFVFNAGFSHDVITDFAGNGAAPGDTVRFAAGLFDDFADMMASSAQQGSDVVITLDAGNVLFLQNTTLAGLHSSDFIFG